MSTELQKADPSLVVYSVAGQEVKLSYQIVRNFLVKGNNPVSDQDLVQFISICKYNQLNPFLNEAYLVKYGTAAAQMIVTKEALMKRADACPNYDGMQAGIIVIRDGQQVELEGCFMLKSDTLVGGWAKVYRSDKKFPIVAKVNLEEYDKKQALWNEKRSTMISKVAKVQALREAFPAQLGAMYTQEEVGFIDIEHEEVRGSVDKTIKIQAEPESEVKEKIIPENHEPTPKRNANKEASAQQPQNGNHLLI